MTKPRAVARIVLATGVATLAVLGFSPAMSFAASSSDTLTVAGGSSYTYTFNQSPSIQAVAQPNCAFLSSASAVTLTISGPGVTDSTLVTHNGSCSKSVTLSPSSSSVNTAHPAWAGGTVPADNGTYTVTLNNQGRTKSASFTLLIPPAKPQGFSVAPAGGTYATFAWQANPEQDIVGYQISDANGNVVDSPTNACNGSSCTDGPIDLGSPVAGQTAHYSIVALRSCGGASCADGHIAGPASDSASATFAAAPSPTPTSSPTKSAGGGSGGGNGGSSSGTSGTTTHGGGNTVSLGSGGSSSGSGSGSITLGTTDKNGVVHDELPPAAAGSAPTVKAPALPGVRTSSESLGSNAKPGNIHYPAPLLAHKADSQSLVHDIKSGLSLPPLWRGIAAAAVLILIAVHLRAWVGRTEGSGFDESGPRPMRTF